MRTAATFIAAAVLAFAVPATAQETMIIEGDAGFGATDATGCCRGRDVQAPPWHGTVCGDPCGPCCPPPNMFHANPWEQLWMKHHAHEQGYCLPPHFPRMHARSTTGWWPTPRPITTPRCPRCGAHIDPGM